MKIVNVTRIINGIVSQKYIVRFHILIHLHLSIFTVTVVVKLQYASC